MHKSEFHTININSLYVQCAPVLIHMEYKSMLYLWAIHTICIFCAIHTNIHGLYTPCSHFRGYTQSQDNPQRQCVLFLKHSGKHASLLLFILGLYFLVQESHLSFFLLLPKGNTFFKGSHLVILSFDFQQSTQVKTCN